MSILKNKWLWLAIAVGVGWYLYKNPLGKSVKEAAKPSTRLFPAVVPPDYVTGYLDAQTLANIPGDFSTRTL